MKKHIAIDLGATSGRIIVGNLEELEVIHRFESFNERLGDSYYWAIIKIFSEIKKGLSLAFKKYGDEIVSIAIDGWGVDYALLDESKSLISPIYHYRDPRNKESVKQIVSLFKNEFELWEETGNALSSYNTIFQLAANKRDRSSLFDIAKYYLSVPDYIAYLLSDVVANEKSEASTTALFDSSTNDWNYDLIDKINIPSSIFSKPIDSGTILGELTDNLKKEFNISHSVSIIATATHDTASAISIIEDNSVYISSGTWSLIGTNLKEKSLSKLTFDCGFTNECGINNEITLVKNVMGMWISNSIIKEELGDKINWKELDEATIKALDYKGLIDPLDEVYLCPSCSNNTMKDRVRNQLIEKGFREPSSIEEYLVAIYRGLADVYRKSISELEEITHKKFKKLYIVGGGSKNQIINQLTADLCKIKVQAGPVEATAIGNILIQEKALNLIKTYESGRTLINKNYETTNY
ncbi:MAG: rhamnulokinase [Spirochaetaceae bacterium]|nr:rhamnulokinase [Spirochaetaceae bacterium]